MSEKMEKKEKRQGKPGRKCILLEYLGGVKKLSPAELEFMELIWENPEGISSEEIYRDPRFQIPQGTKSTILFKINEKGYVHSVQRGLHHFYYPKFTRIQYEQAIVKQKLKNSFGNGSIFDLIALYCGKKKLTEEQIEQINQLFQKIAEEKENQEAVLKEEF